MDPNSTAEILRQHGSFVRTLARALLRDAHTAEDVAQEAWVQWLRRTGTGATARGWLARAVRHLAANQRRASARRQKHEVLGAAPEPARSPADEVEQEELLHRVVEAVYALDEPYRSTLLARYFRGLDARALARESGDPLATVRSREQRGLELLRAKLDRERGGRKAWVLGLTRAASGAAVPAAPLAWLVAAGVLLSVVAWFELRTSDEHDARRIEVAATSSESMERAAALGAEGASAAQREAVPASSDDASAAAQTRSSESGPSPLTGVTVDTDGNPLAGVRVVFRRVAQQRPLAEALSDADGRFRVDGLAMFHTIGAELEGYAFLHATDPDWGEFAPWRPVRITLARLGRLVVHVRDARGAALEDVSVAVEVREEEVVDTRSSEATLAASRPETIEGTTDAEGDVALDVWTGVRLVVAIDLENGIDSGQVECDRERDGALVLDGSAGSPILVQPGHLLELGATWDVARTLRVEVRDSAGRAVPQSTIDLTDQGYPRDAKGWELGSARDDDGAFELAYRPFAIRGPLVLRAYASDRAHALGRASSVPSSTVCPSTLAAEHELTAKELEGEAPIQLVLARSATEGLGGFLSDASGAPITAWGDHRLIVLGTADARQRGAHAGQISGSDGAFYVPGLAPGLYDLVHTSRSVVERFGALGEPAFAVFPRLAAGTEDLELRLPSSGSVELQIRAELLEGLTLSRFFPTDAASFPRALAPSSLILDRQASWCAAAESGEWVADDPEGTWVTTHVVVGGRPRFALGEPGWYRIGAVSADAAVVASERLYFEAGEHVLDVRPPSVNGILRGRVHVDGTRAFYGLALSDEEGRSLPIETVLGRVPVLRLKANGEFLLRALPPGVYRVRVGTLDELERGLFTREARFEVVLGSSLRLELDL